MRGETMPGDGFVRVDYICGAYPEVKATKDPVLGNNGSKADLHSSRDKTAATDLRHATMSATHLIMEGNPSPTPALQTSGTHSAHLALSASVLAPPQKRILAHATIPPPRTDTEIEHPSTINQATGVKSPKPYHNPTRGILPEIYIQTPTGECVPGHEVQWELNPYARVCGDTSGLMEIVPGHHYFQASTKARTTEPL